MSTYCSQIRWEDSFQLLYCKWKIMIHSLPKAHPIHSRSKAVINLKNGKTNGICKSRILRLVENVVHYILLTLNTDQTQNHDWKLELLLFRGDFWWKFSYRICGTLNRSEQFFRWTVRISIRRDTSRVSLSQTFILWFLSDISPVLTRRSLRYHFSLWLIVTLGLGDTPGWKRPRGRSQNL